MDQNDTQGMPMDPQTDGGDMAAPAAPEMAPAQEGMDVMPAGEEAAPAEGEAMA